MNKNNSTLHQIAYRGLSSISSLVTVTANIEEIKKANTSSYYTDVIFLTFKKSIKADNRVTYNKDNEISAKLDSIVLRALSYGIKDSLKKIAMNNINSNGQTQTLYSDRTATTEFFITTLNKKIYFNIKDLESSDKRFIGIELSSHKFMALADSFIIIADLTEKYLYAFQRKSKQTQREVF